MKIIFLTVAFCFSRVLSAQELIIASLRSQPIYLGIDNPLTLFVDGYSCSSLSVITDNGKIEKTGCWYNYRPARLGPAALTIYKKQNGKKTKIKSYNWEVHPFPKPIAQAGPYENGSDVLKGGFCAQAGVAAYAPGGFGFDLTYKVVSFSFFIIRDSTIQFSIQITGNLFNTKIYEACKAMQPGSIVLITNIRVIGPEGYAVKLNPLEYTIR